MGLYLFKKGFQLRKRTIFLSFLIFLLLPACGVMQVAETQYFAVPDVKNENVNFYRLTISSYTQLGVAEYRSGWFPSRAVDALFGDVSDEGGAKSLETRTELEKMVNEKVIFTTQAWLDEASKVKPEGLEDLNKARQRILSYPDGAATNNIANTRQIEYNPAKGLVNLHSDEKQVFILSSNPDEIIQSISAIAENDRTLVTINQMSDMMLQNFKQEKKAKEKEKNDLVTAKEQIITEKINFDSHMAQQIALAIKSLEISKTKTNALLEIEEIIKLIDANLELGE